MKELEIHPYIYSAEITYGGIFDRKTLKKNFWVDRQFEHIPMRLLVRQFEMKFNDKTGIKKMIKELKAKIKELEDALIVLGN